MSHCTCWNHMYMMAGAINTTWVSEIMFFCPWGYSLLSSHGGCVGSDSWVGRCNVYGTNDNKR